LVVLLIQPACRPARPPACLGVLPFYLATRETETLLLTMLLMCLLLVRPQVWNSCADVLIE
jgi:hypothetical protein